MKKSFLIYLSTTLLNALIPYLMLPILARALTLEEFGVVALFQAILTVLVAFVSLGVDGAVGVKYFQCDEDSFRVYLFNALLVVGCGTFLAFLLLQVLGTFSPDGVFSSWWGWLIPLTALSQVLLSIRLSLLQSAGKPFLYGSLQIFQTTVNFLLSLLLVLNVGMGAEGRILGIAVGGFFASVLAFVFLVKGARMKFDMSCVRDVLGFGVPLLPHVILGALYGVLDRFVVSHYLGDAQTGRYFVALQLSLPIFMLGDAFNKAFAPVVYEKVAQGDLQGIQRLAFYSVLGFVCVAVFYALLIGQFLSWFVGERYSDILDVVYFSVAAGFFSASTLSYVNVIYAYRKNLWMSILTILSVGVYLVGGGFFVQLLGIEGMALMALIVKAAVFICVFLVVQVLLVGQRKIGLVDRLGD